MHKLLWVLILLSPYILFAEEVVQLATYIPDGVYCQGCGQSVGALSGDVLRILDRLGEKAPFSVKKEILKLESNHHIIHSPLFSKQNYQCSSGPSTKEEGGAFNLFGESIPIDLQRLKGENLVEISLVGRKKKIFIRKIQVDSEDVLAVFNSNGGILQDFGLYKIEAGKLVKFEDHREDGLFKGSASLSGKKSSKVVEINYDLLPPDKLPIKGNLKLTGTQAGEYILAAKASEELAFLKDTVKVTNTWEGEHREKTDKQILTQRVEVNPKEGVTLFAQNKATYVASNPIAQNTLSYGVALDNDEGATLDASIEENRAKNLESRSYDVSAAINENTLTLSQIESYGDGKKVSVDRNITASVVPAESLVINTSYGDSRRLEEQVRSRTRSAGAEYHYDDDRGLSLNYSDSKANSYGDITKTMEMGAEINPAKGAALSVSHSKEDDGYSAIFTDRVGINYSPLEGRGLRFSLERTRETDKDHAYSGSLRLTEQKHTLDLKYYSKEKDIGYRGTYAFKVTPEDNLKDREGDEDYFMVWIETKKNRITQTRTNSGGFGIGFFN